MKKIIILNFETAEVHVFDYDDNLYSETEEFFELDHNISELGIRENDCHYMVVDKLKLTIH